MEKTSKYLLLIGLIILASCSGNSSKKMQQQIDSLKQVVNFQHKELEDMTSTLDAVAEGIDSINQQEHIIYTGIDEVTGQKMTRTDIKLRIKDLDALIRRQHERIVQLEDSLANKNDKHITSLKTIIASLNKQLEEKQQTINQLEAKVRMQHESISRLTSDVKKLDDAKNQLTNHVAQQEKALERQSNMLNEGYFIIGTRKELKEAGIIAGNILQKSRLDLENADLTKMNKVDIRNFSEVIEIDGKKAKILSQMPEQSYALVKEGNKMKLYIKDAALFWSMSKILVIQKL